MKYYEEFRKIKKWRHISIETLFILLIISAFISNPVLKGILIILSFLLSFVFSLNYKCPNCGYQFDIRISYEKLKHCNNCGIDLQESYLDNWEEPNQAKILVIKA